MGCKIVIISRGPSGNHLSYNQTGSFSLEIISIRDTSALILLYSATLNRCLSIPRILYNADSLMVETLFIPRSKRFLQWTLLNQLSWATLFKSSKKIYEPRSLPPPPTPSTRAWPLHRHTDRSSFEFRHFHCT